MWVDERLKAAVSKTVVGDRPTYREFESPSTTNPRRWGSSVDR